MLLYGKCLVVLILFWGRSQPKQCLKVPPSPVQRGPELSLRFLTSYFNTEKQVWRCLPDRSHVSALITQDVREDLLGSPDPSAHCSPFLPSNAMGEWHCMQPLVGKEVLYMDENFLQG